MREVKIIHSVASAHTWFHYTRKLNIIQATEFVFAYLLVCLTRLQSLIVWFLFRCYCWVCIKSQKEVNSNHIPHPVCLYMWLWNRSIRITSHTLTCGYGTGFAVRFLLFCCPLTICVKAEGPHWRELVGNKPDSRPTLCLCMVMSDWHQLISDRHKVSHQSLIRVSHLSLLIRIRIRLFINAKICVSLITIVTL